MVLAAKMERMEDLLQQLLAQRQPPAPAAAAPVAPDPAVELRQRIQELEEKSEEVLYWKKVADH